MLITSSIFLSLDSVMAQKRHCKYALVIHGGAGSATNDEQVIAAREIVLGAALNKGTSILSGGGTSLDAVEQVIRILEDSPLFNAGKGAVLTATSTNELDATIMDGSTRACGAAGGVTNVKNPISLARLVMTETRHVLLAADGANAFAASLEHPNIEIVSPEYFRTEHQEQRLQRAQEKSRLTDAEQMGTVGCVALDWRGNIAAGTSTGGLVNKKHGRIGDSPIVGAGTFADNRTCGISCTGVGEDFIRNSVAYDVTARMLYKRQRMENAVQDILRQEDFQVRGGMIGIDHKGRITMQFNTAGMSRAAADSDGLHYIKIGK
ncbi:MAG: isoaspartyl peptidase/L-asparaginase [Planctomycetaceae bacterium]|nr:isoaspartyl peptidase/L-asparaginase [Planctomycetaceae bacterium]MBT4725297.1 isoaspartyl peptidase/L-asparaginase [Planctomycetaceae bacterium]MBT5123252.1 isoaspartyl peptidase/L-asparaginase [Planctomycetaceae bacterium]MBT5600070.1 isoaspartyl peptidase/L-asparaginase [Planctomycetaceae bacterium]MBT5883397.1 isoaspartyl peptidase/L-asparaginase [Planctomycetaceae bacterium]